MKKWILAVGVVAALSVAGCSSEGSGDDTAGGGAASTTTTSPTAAYSSSELSAMRATREAARSGDKTSVAVSEAALRAVQQAGSSYEALSDSDFQRMEEGPSSFAGRKIVLYGMVLKGTDGEVVRLAAAPDLKFKSSQYLTTIVLTADDASLLAAHESLDNVVVFGEVTGATTYDDPLLIGETATSPAVKIDTITLLGYH